MDKRIKIYKNIQNVKGEAGDKEWSFEDVGEFIA